MVWNPDKAQSETCNKARSGTQVLLDQEPRQGRSRVWNPGTTGTKQGLEPRSGTKVLLDLEPRHYRDKAGSGPRLMNNVST